MNYIVFPKLLHRSIETTRLFRLDRCIGYEIWHKPSKDQHLVDHQRRNQESSKPLARQYVVYSKCLTHWRVLLRVFFRSGLEHGFSFARISDNR
jgi:hypothetical protein